SDMDKHIAQGLYRQKFSVQQRYPRGGFLTSEARMEVLQGRKKHSLEMISISPSFYPFQWIIQNHNHKSSFLIRQLSISMDNFKIFTLSFITWIFGTEIITEHYFISS